jgi:hypothetical protein
MIAGCDRASPRLKDALLVRSSIVGDVIVYRARRLNAVVQREIDRLARDLPDLKIFVVCYEPGYLSARHSIPGKSYCYGWKDLGSLPYPQKLCANSDDAVSQPQAQSGYKKFSGEMTAGHHDLAVMKFFLDCPDFDRYWLIEDDVRCSGPWTDIFGELAKSNADLLMTVVQNYLEVPKWYWWHSLVTGKDTLPRAEQLKGFTPFCRLSGACMRAVDQKYREGWGGHYEVTWPNIALVSGLSVEDVGGEGSYTPTDRRGRFYVCTPGSAHLFPGTFVFRPCFHDMGVSEFGRDVTVRTMLWHPVKA